MQKLTPAERHVLVLRAAVGNLSGRVVATGHSALAAYGVPLWGVAFGDLHVHREATRSSRREAGISHRRGAIDDEEIRLVRGLLVASPERAVVDACREVGFEAGVVLADGARRLLDFDLSAARAIVERQRDWPYSSRASRALSFSDRRAATVGESRARVLLARLGVPEPDLQRTILDARTQTVQGITDFYVDEYATAIEFDGKLKYGRALYERSGRSRTSTWATSSGGRSAARMPSAMRVTRWSGWSGPSSTARTGWSRPASSVPSPGLAGCSRPADRPRLWVRRVVAGCGIAHRTQRPLITPA